MPETPPYSPEAAQFFTAVRQAVPSFAVLDEARRHEWDDDPAPLGYIRAAGLAEHVVALAAAGRWLEVRSVLELAEGAIQSGDGYTRTLMAEGLLEDIQGAALCSDRAVRLVEIRRLLGPLSLKAWDALMELWHGPAHDARKKLPEGSLPGDDG